MVSRGPGRLAVLLVLGSLPTSGGCVTVYQPLSGLQTPVIVDPQLENFKDTRLVVQCLDGDFLTPGNARALCKRVEDLFVNQGAKVETIAFESRIDKGVAEEGESEIAPKTATPREGLRLELRARRLKKDTSGLMWVLSILTFTLVPAMSEHSYVQEVAIRDERGSLLATAELKGRIVRYFGLGYWIGNNLVNLILRDDDEDLNSKTFKTSVSNDLYGQLSQLLFNAKLRQRVLMSPVSTSSVTKAGG